jgi:hypothetical protein
MGSTCTRCGSLLAELEPRSTDHLLKPCAGRAMAQAVSRQPLTRRIGLAPGIVHEGFVVDNAALG